MPTYTTENTGSEVLPDGSEWEFVVGDAHEKLSQAGNEMIELQLRIITGSGKGPLIYDSLVFTPKSCWKIDAFRQSTGEKLIPGQQVTFTADDCLDRRGHVVLKIDVYEGKSRNKVDYYTWPDEQAASSSRAPLAKTAEPRPVLKNELGEPLDIPF